MSSDGTSIVSGIIFSFTISPIQILTYFTKIEGFTREVLGKYLVRNVMTIFHFS